MARTARRCLVASYFFLCTKKGSPAQGEAILAQAGTSAVGCFANRIVSKGSRQQSDAHQSVGSYEELDKGTHTYSHTHACTPWHDSFDGAGQGIHIAHVGTVNGLGAGRALVGAALGGACFSHILSVLDSIEFWEKMGFTPAGEKPPPLTEAKGHNIPRPSRAVCVWRARGVSQPCISALCFVTFRYACMVAFFVVFVMLSVVDVLIWYVSLFGFFICIFLSRCVLYCLHDLKTAVKPKNITFLCWQIYPAGVYWLFSSISRLALWLAGWLTGLA